MMVVVPVVQGARVTSPRSPRPARAGAAVVVLGARGRAAPCSRCCSSCRCRCRTQAEGVVWLPEEAHVRAGADGLRRARCWCRAGQPGGARPAADRERIDPRWRRAAGGARGARRASSRRSTTQLVLQRPRAGAEIVREELRRRARERSSARASAQRELIARSRGATARFIVPQRRRTCRAASSARASCSATCSEPPQPSCAWSSPRTRSTRCAAARAASRCGWPSGRRDVDAGRSCVREVPAGERPAAEPRRSAATAAAASRSTRATTQGVTDARAHVPVRRSRLPPRRSAADATAARVYVRFDHGREPLGDAVVSRAAAAVPARISMSERRCPALALRRRGIAPAATPSATEQRDGWLDRHRCSACAAPRPRGAPPARSGARDAPLVARCATQPRRSRRSDDDAAARRGAPICAARLRSEGFAPELVARVFALVREAAARTARACATSTCS